MLKLSSCRTMFALVAMFGVFGSWVSEIRGGDAAELSGQESAEPAIPQQGRWHCGEWGAIMVLRRPWQTPTLASEGSL